MCQLLLLTLQGTQDLCLRGPGLPTFRQTSCPEDRLPKELQAVFATNLLRQKNKSGWTALNREFTNWCISNSWILR